MAKTAKTLKEKIDAAKTGTAAETMIDTEKKEQGEPAKRAVSFFVDPALYEDARQLAQFRAAQGKRNDQGQPYSIGALLNEALKAYLDSNSKELEDWKNYSEIMAQYIKK